MVLTGLIITIIKKSVFNNCQEPPLDTFHMKRRIMLARQPILGILPEVPTRQTNRTPIFVGSLLITSTTNYINIQIIKQHDKKKIKTYIQR